MYYNMIGILAFHVCESNSVYLVKALKCDRSAKWCRNNGYEQKVKMALKKHGILVIDFPYFDSAGISAVGSYLNFLETEKHIFLPIFGSVQDETAVKSAKEIFEKKIVAVNINGIAKDGGVLNCISWETD